MTENNFIYVEFGTPPSWHNNRYIKINEIQEWAEKYGNREIYISAFRYQQPENPNENTLVIGDLYFDIDCDDDLNAALEDARAVVETFHKSFEIPKNCIRIYFTGKKGFRVIIPCQCLGAEPNKDLHKIYRRIAEGFYESGYKTVDTQVYQKNRFLRLPNTIHGSTGLYMIPLTYDELQTSAIYEIKELAKKPRIIEFADPVLSEKARELYIVNKKRIGKPIQLKAAISEVFDVSALRSVCPAMNEIYNKLARGEHNTHYQNVFLSKVLIPFGPAGEKEIHRLLQLSKKENYDLRKTQYQINYSKNGKCPPDCEYARKTWGLCGDCDGSTNPIERMKEAGRQKEKQSKTAKNQRDKKPKIIYESALELPDGKYAEEIIVDGVPVFVVYDDKTACWEIVNEIEFEGENPPFSTDCNEDKVVIRPYPVSEPERYSITLPDGVEEYGDVKTLRQEMLDFALSQYDPLSNKPLFELIVNLALTSWVPEWQDDMAERFLPIIQTRGASETGKKRFLSVMRYLFYRPAYMLKTYRVPSLFRPLSTWRGTLILDEADLSDSSLSSEFIQFINSRADGVPISRYSAEKDKSTWFRSFGYTILAVRKPFADDGAESRSVVFPAEATDRPEDYDLLLSPEWRARGLTLQRKLLLFRLRHRKRRSIPGQLLIPGIKSFRVREALLMLQALKDEDPSVLENIGNLAKELEYRVVLERAASPEGLILNVVYSWLSDTDEVYYEQRDDGYILIREKIVRNPNEEIKEQYPLTLRTISDSLGKSFSPAEISRFWRGLGQKVLSLRRVGGKRFRGIIIISNPKRLRKDFLKYVPDLDAEVMRRVDEITNLQTNLQGFKPTGSKECKARQHQNIEKDADVTDVTDVTPAPTSISATNLKIDNAIVNHLQSYLLSHRGIPKHFFVEDMLRQYPNVDKKALEEFYETAKMSEKSRQNCGKTVLHADKIELILETIKEECNTTFKNSGFVHMTSLRCALVKKGLTDCAEVDAIVNHLLNNRQIEEVPNPRAKKCYRPVVGGCAP